MKTTCLLILLTILFRVSCFAQDTKTPASTSYLYKIPIEVQSGDTEYTDKLIRLNIDLKDKLKECYATGKKVDEHAIAVEEVDARGKMISRCVAQYEVDQLLWMMEGVMPKSTTRYFNILFNTTDQPAVATQEKPLITRKDTVGNWAFTTPNGYFVYETRGGAFNVFAPQVCQDNAYGKDWVRGDYKEYNGILNIGDPNTKAIFHPHHDTEADDGIWQGSKSDLIVEGPLHYQIRAINSFGELPGDYRSNTVYRVLFDIYPHYITATVTQGNEHGYASVMEMTPGGDSLETSDYVVASDGRTYHKGDTLAADLSPEWFLVGDAQDSARLFFSHLQDDSSQDGIHWYDFMQGLMVGFGRGANPGIHTYPNTFYMGFTPQSGAPGMQKLVASLSNTPTIEVGTTRKQSRYSWGDITIKKEAGNLEVTLENSLFKCAYSPVMTANLETAITEFLVKPKQINISGKHMDEMARDQRDRGVLSDKTGVVFENEDHKTVHLEWDQGQAIEEVTMYKDKPYLKIDYQKMYINICDMGNEQVFADGQYKFYGDKAWAKKRAQKLKDKTRVPDDNPHHQLTAELYPSYPHPLLGDWGIPAKENPMNYKGWYILGVYSPSKGVGYGRVVPATAVDHMKLLNTHGFEQFPQWFDKQVHTPFTEYLFVFTDESKMMDLGKEIADQANSTPWYSIDTSYHAIGNSLIEVGYGPDRITEGNRLTGLTLFRHKPSNINLANALDAYGCDYAHYFKGGPTRYEITHQGDDYVEATVTLTSDSCLKVIKKERIYPDWPVLEIAYQQLDLLWWEDFYTLEDEQNRQYTMLGVKQPITPDLHATYRAEAEQACGHNFGDCYLKAAGTSLDSASYHGYFIFGFYDKDTKVGLGFVLPTAIGLHDGFKLWSMHNYESFPFHDEAKTLPLKRWIFAVSDGQQEIMALGKQIVDRMGRK